MILAFLLTLLGIAFAFEEPIGTVVSSNKAPVLINPAGSGEVQMLLTSEKTKDTNIYLGRARFLPGASVPEHVHETSVEVVYIFGGSGQLKIGRETTEVKEGDAIYIPRNTPHSFQNTGAVPVSILQMYTPAGPEERFRSWEPKK
jgi:mannose-6-phosphate isomerase-like protein (cupin superfamily)